MRIGKYKGIHDVKVYEDGDEFLIEFKNGNSITTSDLSEVEFPE